MSVGVFSVFGCLGGVSIDLGDILGCQSCSRVFEGIFGDSLHEGFSQTGANPPFWPNPERQDFFSPGAFETSKYQNLPIYHFQKRLSFAIFLIFHVCQREITIYSLFGSPCRNNFKFRSRQLLLSTKIFIRTFIRINFTFTNIFRHSFVQNLFVRIYSDIHPCV